MRGCWWSGGRGGGSWGRGRNDRRRLLRLRLKCLRISLKPPQGDVPCERIEEVTSVGERRGEAHTGCCSA